MNRSLGVIGTSFIGMGLVAILLVPTHRPLRPETLPGPWSSLQDQALFHPASAANKLVSETAALKATVKSPKRNQKSVSSSAIEYSGYDHIQYFPAGPENKLATETETLKAARAAAKAAQRLQR